jgi:hypothetical protein
MSDSQKLNPEKKRWRMLLSDFLIQQQMKGAQSQPSFLGHKLSRKS